MFIGLLTTLLSGPLVGMVGSVIGAFTEHKKREQDLEFQKLKDIQELALLDKHLQARGKEMEHEGLIAETTAHTEAYVASMADNMIVNSDPMPWWVGAVKSLTRPGLTFMLVIMVGVIFFAVDAAKPDTIQGDIILAILYLTEVAVTWWFADRARKKSRDK